MSRAADDNRRTRAPFSKGRPFMGALRTRVRWPNWIMASGGLVLWAAALPILHGPEQPPAATGLVYTLTIAAFAAAQFRLRLFAAGWVSVLSSFTWLLILAESV